MRATERDVQRKSEFKFNTAPVASGANGSNESQNTSSGRDKSKDYRAPPSAEAQTPVIATTESVFQAKKSFRELVRSEIMEEELDDRHDILGNTLYRLSFGTTILTGDDKSSVAVIAVSLTHDFTPPSQGTEEDETTKAVARAQAARTSTPQDPNYDGPDSIERTYQEWVRFMQTKIDSWSNAIADQVALGVIDDINLRTTLAMFFERRLCLEITNAAKLSAMSTGDENKLGKEGADRRCNLRQSPEALTATTLVEKYAKEFAKAYDAVKAFRLGNAALEAANSSLTKAGQTEDKTALSGPVKMAKISTLIDAMKNTFCDDQGRMKIPMAAGAPADVSCLDNLYNASQDPGLMGMAVLYNSVIEEKNGNGFKNTSVLEFIEKAIDEITDKNNHCNDTNTDNCLDLKTVSVGAAKCIASNYLVDSLNKEFIGSSSISRRLSEFVTPKIVGEQFGNCVTLISPQTDWSQGPSETQQMENTELAAISPAARALLKALNVHTEVFTYSVEPKKIAQQISARSETLDTLEAAMALDTAPGDKVNTSATIGELMKKWESARAIEDDPVVVGFSAQPPDVNQDKEELGRHAASFGWAIAPRLRVNGAAQIDGEYTLSGVVSVPGWWRWANITVSTCWIARRELASQLNSASCSGKRSVASPKPFAVRLPGSPAEISFKLGFDVVQEPHLQRRHPAQAPYHFEIGHAADILLVGERLWRSTEVTLGSQKADEIIVLPNMEGIVARFSCVEAQESIQSTQSTERSRTSGSPQVEIRVWTSEGVTEPEFAVLDVPPWQLNRQKAAADYFFGSRAKEFDKLSKVPPTKVCPPH